jgi:carotenoid cleavage dioxygenase-like enzyme
MPASRILFVSAPASQSEHRGALLSIMYDVQLQQTHSHIFFLAQTNNIAAIQSMKIKASMHAIEATQSM